MEVPQERDDGREGLNYPISMYMSGARQIDTLNNILEVQSGRKMVCGADVSDEAIHEFLQHGSVAQAQYPIQQFARGIPPST
jgi:hypothetical protein